MQTFLPFPSFKTSLKCLDYRRLGKQRVEAFQLLCANGDEWALTEREWRREQGFPVGSNSPKGWKKHPAAIMWRHYEDALREYYNESIKEWLARGYNNTLRFAPIPGAIEVPPWIGNEKFHASHRSNLIRKDPIFYGKYNWNETPDMEYIWP